MLTIESASPEAENNTRFGNAPLDALRANLAAVEARIGMACDRAGRSRASVRLLPITKTVPADILRFALEAGLTTFGENKVQEAAAKHRVLGDLTIDWAIVGHLQTNKVKYVTRFASEFHALDSLRLAEAIDHRLDLEGRSLDIYVQVNTSGEQSKFGLHPDELLPFIDALEGFPRLNPKGLMTLGLFSADHDQVRQCFSLLRRLRDAAIERNSGLTELSMGMSGDFEVAIAEGADVVRLGQAIFGERPLPDSHYWPGAA